MYQQHDIVSYKNSINQYLIGNNRKPIVWWKTLPTNDFIYTLDKIIKDMSINNIKV